jgi:hypothetical protein
MHADATTSAPASGATAYYANSWLHFEVVAVLGFGNRVQIGELDLNTQYAGNAQLGGDYTYTYSNNTDFNQQLYFDNVMFVSASHVVAAVPEPSTYAMLGVGLALLGVMRRRRA